MNGKRLFHLSLFALYLFITIVLFSGIVSGEGSFAKLKEGFEWITVYIVPWIIVILLAAILRKKR
ncbi:hypothetical protein EBB07_21240 [Paenibacillaceae bacterium]|nr:hypothetical protein EBB07_21240 [Paenibacillaceae bacterium]